MRPGDIFVKVDGVHLRSLGHVSRVKWGTRYGDGPCGPDLASVDIDFPAREDTGFLRMGRTLEVYDRGLLRFGGPITSTGRGAPRLIEAKGWARRDWDATLAPEPGARIGRNPDRSEFIPTAPTAPTLLLDASDLDIGVADDRLFTRVVAEYVTAVDAEGNTTATSQVTAVDSTAEALFGELPFPLDLTPLGLIDTSTALSYAQQQVNEFAIPEWTSRVVTTSDRLLTMNGHASHLPDVKAGQMVRMFHMPSSYGGLRRVAATDVVLGEVEFSTDTPDEITIAPARVAVRSIADMVRELGELRRAAA